MSALVELVGGTEVRVDEHGAAWELAADLQRAGGVPRRLEHGLDEVVTYLDKDFLLTRPDVLRRVARHVGVLVGPTIDRLATTASVSMMLGTAVSLQTGVPIVVVDDAEAVVRGAWYGGERVVLVEDVVLSGSTALRSVDLLRAAGLVVDEVVAAVDRVAGASALLDRHGVELRKVFDLPLGATP